MRSTFHLPACVRQQRLWLLPMGALSGPAFAYAYTLAPGLTWANSGADGGDLVAATATMGVAHPPGYPTYILLARLFQFVPLGELAVRTSLLSLVAALLACACVAVLVGRLAGGGLEAMVAAAVAALWFGLSPIFWSQAVIVEVYTLNALFTGLLWLFTARATGAVSPGTFPAGPPGDTGKGFGAGKIRPGPPIRTGQTILLPGVIAGLALGNHPTAALAVVCWLAALSITAGKERMRVLLRALAGIAAGGLVYLYLPLRAATNPPINWGDPDTVEGFVWLVSGQAYHGRLSGASLDQLGERAAAWAAALVDQFGWPGVVLGIVGLLYSPAAHRLFLRLSLVAGVGWSLFAASYTTTDSYTYLIPFFLLFATWIGLGITLAFHHSAQLHPLLVRAGTLVLILFIASGVPATASAVKASDDADAFARRTLAAAPPEALILTSTDQETFPLWYRHFALKSRPDIAIVVEPMLGMAWYRQNLHTHYPDLLLPAAPVESWEATLRKVSRGRRPICRASTTAAAGIICTIDDHAAAPHNTR